MRHSIIRIVSTLGACVLSTSWALAQEADQYRDDFLTDKFSVAVGAFFPDAKTAIRADAADGTFGTTLSTEKDLNIGDSDASLDISMLWRISKKHRVELEYFNISQDGVKTLDANIRFGDSVFEEQFEIDSSLKTRVIRVGYGYSFVNDARNEFGLHLGLHVTDIDAAVAVVGDGDGSGLREAAGATAPLPVIGAHGSHRFGNRWVVYGRAQYFKLDVNDFDGDMIQYAVGIEHDTFERVSLGLAFKSFEIDIGIEKDDWLGNADFKYSGPTLYFRLGFGAL